jgi:hypothetical protein
MSRSWLKRRNSHVDALLAKRWSNAEGALGVGPWVDIDPSRQVEKVDGTDTCITGLPQLASGQVLLQACRFVLHGLFCSLADYQA